MKNKSRVIVDCMVYIFAVICVLLMAFLYAHDNFIRQARKCGFSEYGNVDYIPFKSQGISQGYWIMKGGAR